MSLLDSRMTIICLFAVVNLIKFSTFIGESLCSYKTLLNAMSD